MRCLKISALLPLLGPAVLASVISVQPSSQTVNLGAQAIVSVNISGLGNGVAPSLGTFDLSVVFDPTVLAFNSNTFGNQLDILGLGDIQSVTLGLGSVDIFELSLDLPSDLNSLQTPAFTLSTLKFDAVGTGSSPVTLTLNALGDADGNSLSATVINGSVKVGGVSNVPEPSTVVLLMSGFVVFGFWALGRRISQV